MKIGDKCFVSGYIDEIRKDTVIVRNSGGYFGTSPGEVITVYNTAHPNWIPCSDRLPEEDGDYIVTFEKGYASDYGLDPIGIAPFEVDCEGFGFWQEQFDMHTLGSLGSDWVDINVIAWMPLPEPYREGEG